jgi:membrane associated rhomboid family serine protease
MQEVQTCYRHQDRRAGVSCQRCNRPICPDCMHQASVGFQCPECAGASGSREVSGRSVLRQHDTPIVTNALIAINLAVFVYGLFSGGSFGGTGGLSSFEIKYSLLGAGQLSSSQVIGVADGEWYRLITGAFLHGGLIHIGLNMYVLYILGPQLERALGHLEYAAIYLVALLAGAFGALVLTPFEPTVGASGAIYGLFGAIVVLQRRLGMNPWTSGIAGLILINLLLTFAFPGISIGGHIGGLIGGAMAAFVVLEATAQRQPALALLGCAALALAFGFGAVWAAETAFTTGHALLSF